MTLEEFTALPVDNQAQHVWAYDQYLMNRQGQRTTATLYAVGSFYVEVWNDRGSNNIMSKLF